MKILRSIISPEAILKIVSKQYSFNNIIDCKIIKAGGSNDIYKLTTNKKKYIVKVYSIRSCWPYCENHYLFEINLQTFLNEKNISVPKPIPDRNGLFINTISAPEYQKYYAVYSYLNGEACDDQNISASLFYYMGAELANLHIISQDFSPITGATRTLNIDFLLRNSHYRIKNFFVLNRFSQKLCKKMDNVYFELENDLQSIQLKDLAFGIIHGDVHLENYLLTNKKISFLDFELSGYGCFLYDLATFKWRLSISSDKHFHTNLMDNFINGYLSKNPKLKIELDLINIFVRLRHFFILGSSAILYPDNPQQLVEKNFLNYIEQSVKF